MCEIFSGHLCTYLCMTNVFAYIVPFRLWNMFGFWLKFMPDSLTVVWIYCYIMVLVQTRYILYVHSYMSKQICGKVLFVFISVLFIKNDEFWFSLLPLIFVYVKTVGRYRTFARFIIVATNTVLHTQGLSGLLFNRPGMKLTPRLFAVAEFNNDWELYRRAFVSCTRTFPFFYLSGMCVW